MLSLSQIILPRFVFRFFFNATAPTEIYTLSLHDALPIFEGVGAAKRHDRRDFVGFAASRTPGDLGGRRQSLRSRDRKSTRLNSSHGSISYAVFCLKKKKKQKK